MEEVKPTLKVMVVGDGGVGKSAMMKHFVDGSSGSDIEPGDDVIHSRVKNTTIDGKSVTLQIWDTPEQARRGKFDPRDFDDVQGVVLAFDLTDRTSFEHAKGKWLEQIRAYASEDVKIILVGTKSELVERRAVSEEEARKFAEELGVSYVEVSSKTGANVDVVFETLAREVMGLAPAPVQKETVSPVPQKVVQPAQQPQSASLVNDNNKGPAPVRSVQQSQQSAPVPQKVSTTEMAHLYDVDGTLINDDGTFNDELIDRMVREGIKGIYIFSRMGPGSFKPEGVTRFELIQHLQARGIEVLGVITSNDKEYNETNPNALNFVGEFYNKYLKPAEELRIEIKKGNVQSEEGAATLARLADIYEEARNPAYYKEQKAISALDRSIPRDDIAQREELERRVKALKASSSRDGDVGLEKALQFEYAHGALRAEKYAFTDDAASQLDGVRMEAERQGVAVELRLVPGRLAVAIAAKLGRGNKGQFGAGYDRFDDNNQKAVLNYIDQLQKYIDYLPRVTQMEEWYAVLNKLTLFEKPLDIFSPDQYDTIIDTAKREGAKEEAQQAKANAQKLVEALRDKVIDKMLEACPQNARYDIRLDVGAHPFRQQIEQKANEKGKAIQLKFYFARDLGRAIAEAYGREKDKYSQNYQDKLLAYLDNLKQYIEPLSHEQKMEIWKNIYNMVENFKEPFNLYAPATATKEGNVEAAQRIIQALKGKVLMNAGVSEKTFKTLNLFDGNSDPFSFRLNNGLGKIAAAHRALQGVDIAHIVDAVIAKPESAAAFFKPRPFAFLPGRQNFRKALAQNPEALKKLMRSGDPLILAEIDKFLSPGLFANFYLSRAERERLRAVKANIPEKEKPAVQRVSDGMERVEGLDSTAEDTASSESPLQARSSISPHHQQAQKWAHISSVISTSQSMGDIAGEQAKQANPKSRRMSVSGFAESGTAESSAIPKAPPSPEQLRAAKEQLKQWQAEAILEKGQKADVELGIKIIQDEKLKAELAKELKSYKGNLRELPTYDQVEGLALAINEKKSDGDLAKLTEKNKFLEIMRDKAIENRKPSAVENKGTSAQGKGPQKGSSEPSSRPGNGGPNSGG